MPAFAFSYASRLPEGMGRPVLFEGISCFRFQGELIAHYSEAFDRGLALVQLAFPAERIRRILEKAARAQNRRSDARVHLDRILPGGGLPSRYFSISAVLAGWLLSPVRLSRVRRARSPSAAARRPPRG